MVRPQTACVAVCITVLALQIYVLGRSRPGLLGVRHDMGSGFLTNEIVDGLRISQVMRVDASGLQGITLHPNPSHPSGKAWVVFELFDLAKRDVDAPVRRVTAAAGDVAAGSAYVVRFVPIDRSAGRWYRLDVLVPGAEAGEGIRLNGVDGHHTDGGTMLVNGQEAFADLVFQTGVVRERLLERLGYHLRTRPWPMPDRSLLSVLCVLAVLCLLGLCVGLTTAASSAAVEARCPRPLR